MKQRVPWGQIIVGMLAVVCGSLAAFSFVERRHYAQLLEKAQTVPPSEFKIDLASVETTTAPFHQHFSGSHGEYLALITEPRFASPKEAKIALAGLTGCFHIKTLDGSTVLEQEFTASEFLQGAPRDSYCPALYFLPLPTGNYQLSITVDRPTSGMEGYRQSVQAGYSFCGLETFPLAVYTALTVVSSTLGVVFVAAFVRLRGRKLVPVDSA